MTQMVGRYELVRCIGTGGMAEVHLARVLEATGYRWVVVKRMLPHLQGKSDFTRMFVDEARVASRLNHPNVLKVYDYGETEAIPFMALEYVEGVHLGALLAHIMGKDQAIPIAMVAYMVSQACRGLHYAHEATDEHGDPLEIVHRDVSPQNIMVNRQGEVKLLDFGIAKTALQSAITKSGVLKGKLGYMAPEHCSGSTLDRRADVYSMGVTLHELLTGTRLYPESNPLLVVRRITQEDVQPPSTLNPAVPAALDELVMAATARLLRQRIPDAKTLADRLDAWLFKRKDRPTPESLAAWLESAAAEILPVPLPAAPTQDSPPPPSIIHGRGNAAPASNVTNPWEDVNLSTNPASPPAQSAARPSGGFTPPPGGGDQGVTGSLPRTVVERTTARTGTDGRGWEPDSQNRPVVMGQVVLEVAPPVPAPRPLPAPRTPAPRLVSRDWRTEPTQPEVTAPPAPPKLVPPPVTMPPVADAPAQPPTLVSPALAQATGFRSELNQMFADAVSAREQTAAPQAPMRAVASRGQKPRSWRRHGTNPFLKKVPADERTLTQAFYERIFSAFASSGSIQGGQQIYVSHGQQEAVLSVPGAQPVPGQWVPFVHLPSLEPVLLLVPQLGGKVVQGVTPSAAGVFALIQDPSGGTLGLFSAAPSR